MKKIITIAFSLVCTKGTIKFDDPLKLVVMSFLSLKDANSLYSASREMPRPFRDAMNIKEKLKLMWWPSAGRPTCGPTVCRNGRVTKDFSCITLKPLPLPRDLLEKPYPEISGKISKRLNNNEALIKKFTILLKLLRDIP